MAELEAVARTLGKTLNCESPKRGSNDQPIDCCDQCVSCRRINEENHPDVLSVRPESKSRVILIVFKCRDLMQTVNLKPTMAPV
jgi:DNA polymerase-3 subunit delta'